MMTMTTSTPVHTEDRTVNTTKSVMTTSSNVSTIHNRSNSHGTTPTHHVTTTSTPSTLTTTTQLPLPLLYKYLHLEHYTPHELEQIFQRIVVGSGVGSADVVTLTHPHHVTPSQEMEEDHNRTTTSPLLLTHQNLQVYLRQRISELELERDLYHIRPMTTSTNTTTTTASIATSSTTTPPLSESSSTSLPSSSSLTQLSSSVVTTDDRNITTTTTTAVGTSTMATSYREEYESDRTIFIQQEATRILQLLVVVSSSSSSLHNNNTNQMNDTNYHNRKQIDSTSIPPMTMTQTQFVDRITTLASQVDVQRSIPVFVSMLLVGASVGVIAPAMPFVVQSLQLSTAQYGHVVAAFGWSKMIGNIPAAILVERHGRKPYMTYSLAIIAMGVGGIGLASSFETLYLCRLLTGFGVAALSTAGTLMITDISTPLNRASTYAPIMSAFAAGTAVGPALGGMLVDQFGLQTTFIMVGLSYFGVALVNQSLLKETKPTPMEFPWQRQLHEQYEREQKLLARSKNNNTMTQLPSSRGPERNERDVETFGDAIQSAFGQWMPLLKDPMIRSVMILNGIYWIAIAGGQMTLLPLILTNDLHYTATQVGQVYMGMSMIQIFGNPIFGKLIDKIGKVPVIIGATTCIGTAMYTLPYACSAVIDPTNIISTTTTSMETVWPLAMTLGLWSIGSSMLSTAPLAYVSDRVDDSKRAQAIALLRTCGDIGFLIGATGTGAFADYTNSIDLTMQSNGSLLLGATVWFALRQLLRSNPISKNVTTTMSSVTNAANPATNTTPTTK